MELKIARSELSKAPNNISLSDIEKEVAKTGQRIFYFDRENQHKDLIALIEHFKKKNMVLMKMNLCMRIIYFE